MKKKCKVFTCCLPHPLLTQIGHGNAGNNIAKMHLFLKYVYAIIWEISNHGTLQLLMSAEKNTLFGLRGGMPDKP